MRKSLEEKIDDSWLQVWKSVALNILFAVCLYKIHTIEAIFIFLPLLICTLITTYDWLDRIEFMKKEIAALEEK